jgi:hypothetical protein
MFSPKPLVPPPIGHQVTLFDNTPATLTTIVTSNSEDAVPTQNPSTDKSQGAEYAEAVFAQITNEFTLNDVIDFKLEFTRLLNAKVKNLLS